MKFILGTKEYMTQVFNGEGTVFPVTVVSATPSVVVQVKSKETDGYESVQLGFGKKSARKIAKPQKGHMKDLGNFRVLREFKPEVSKSGQPELKVGDKIDLSVFKEGDVVQVSGITKGKGFQGVVKRHGFKGGPRSHGQKHSEREPGSIGGGGRDGGRVAKGMRMAGRMGNDRVTVKNLKVVAIDPEKHEIMIQGALPGRKGTVLEIRG